MIRYYTEDNIGLNFLSPYVRVRKESDALLIHSNFDELTFALPCEEAVAGKLIELLENGCKDSDLLVFLNEHFKNGEDVYTELIQRGIIE